MFIEKPIEVIVEKIVEVFVDRVIEVPVEVFLNPTSLSVKQSSYQHNNIVSLEQSPYEYAREDEELLLLENSAPSDIFNDYKQEILEIPV